MLYSFAKLGIRTKSFFAGHRSPSAPQEYDWRYSGEDYRSGQSASWRPRPIPDPQGERVPRRSLQD